MMIDPVAQWGAHQALESGRHLDLRHPVTGDIAQRGAVRRLDREPQKHMRAKGERIGALTDGRERIAAEQLHRHHRLEFGQIEFRVLDEAREIGDHQDALILERANERQDAGIFGIEELDGAAAEGLELAAQHDQAAHPP